MNEDRIISKEEPLFQEETIKKAMEAAGYTYDEIESSEGNLRFFGAGSVLRMDSWNEAAEWLEGISFDDPQVSDRVEGILHPERFTHDRYSIYQLNHDKPQTHALSFASYSEVQKMGIAVDPKNYACVYYDTLKPGETLDSIYERFNLYHPADFRGHSLSVSDVIVLHQSGVDTAYYVDSFGFKQVPEFTAHNPLEKVEELLEDDYGMIDGIINNGPRKDEQEKDGGRKSSILDKLKEKKQEAEEQALNTMPVTKKDRSEIDL
ncbi:MAG: YodL domain-containing protein [Eubacteriales bacterium]|nr:YodL domain-containing protein [Eubacteriales bacterium]